MPSAAKMLRVSFVQCRGTPYEVGRAQADALAVTRKGKAFLRKKVQPPLWFKIRNEERAFRSYAPDLWEEIGGIAERLNIPMEQAVLCFGNDGLRMPTGGCSAIMSGGVYGRNYDFWPRGYEARFALVQVRGSYASIGGSHQLTGRLDGMNEHGLTIGLHLVKVLPRFPGLTSTLLVRRVLDSCATTAEAIDLLRRLPHAMKYNYSLLDAGGVAAVVEAGAGAVVVRRGDWLACTNHFQSPQLRRLNRRPAHSIGRLPPLENWAARELTAEQIFKALNFSASPAFHNYGNAQTLHTIITEPPKRRLLIGIGGDAAALEEDMIDVDFKLWVAGEDLPIEHLKGQLGLGLPSSRRPRARPQLKVQPRQ
jgi:predicted choloylglycine hydrolase